jgi:hypothetical protein
LEGKFDVLAGLLQEKYGYTRERAADEIDNGIANGLDCSGTGLFLTLEGPRTIQSYLLLAPQTQRESIGDLISAMESKVGFYMIGQAFL